MSRGLEAAVSEDGNGWKEEKKKSFVSWGQGKSLKGSLCHSAQLRDLRGCSQWSLNSALHFFPETHT